ncbi:MAG: potassium transporter TrkG [Verrucomicrobiales bacterium]|nr:potassium transporter TrkG [Verrucomicrobiales bacterium]
MNYRRLAKVLGIVLLFVAAMMLAVIGYAVVEGIYRHPDAKSKDAIHALLVSLAITVAVGGGLLGIGWNTKNEFLRREAMATVGLSWFLAAFFCGLPYFFTDPGDGQKLGAVESFFESMSGLTTTGSSVMTDIEAFPKAILLWRAVTQFMGGIGILVLFVSVLSFLGVGGKNLFAQESSLNISDSRATKIGETAFGLLKVYLVLTFICFIGLLALGMPMLDSLCHCMTAMSTGGFSSRNDSIGYYDDLGIEIWLSIFMLLGSISFMFYLLLVKKNKDDRDIKRIKNEEEGKFYVIFVLVAIAMVSFDLMMTPERNFLQGLRESFFMIVSISSTSGFGLADHADYDQWPTFSRIILWVLMVVGGCGGSTAGGLKMNRMILFKRVAVKELTQSFRPQKIIKIKINGSAADEKTLLHASMFLALAMAICGLSMVVVAMIEPDLDFESVVGVVAGCLFNIGPGFGMVGPTDNFAFLNHGTMVFLAVLMAMGRLEFVAVLVLFVPSLWKRY